MRSRRKFEPVGDILVSYEAKQMPTAVLERLLKENDSDPIVLAWLMRIALHKLNALEGTR
jgi:hypothetical protein